MKKLNRKGFTLIELLATIVVLSLVTGVAVPVTTNIVSTSKHKALGTFVDEAEDFIADQWRIKKVSPDTMADSFENVMGTYTIKSDPAPGSNLSGIDNPYNWVVLNVKNANDKALIEDMGIPSEDVSTVHVRIDKDDIPCVVISKIPVGSGIYNSLYWGKVTGSDGKEVIPKENNDRYYSKCCLENIAQAANSKWGE